MPPRLSPTRARARVAAPEAPAAVPSASFVPRPLPPDAHRAAMALAEAIVPGSGARLLRADEASLAEVHALLEHTLPHLGDAWGAAARALDTLALGWTGRRFSSLPRERQDALLRRWEASPALGPILQAFALPLKLAHFDRLGVYEALGGRRSAPRALERPRWLAQVIDATTVADDTVVECDVVVVGSGAGGAVVGKELADRGLAVVFVEEGEHVRRDRFTGSSLAAHRELYRGAVALGRSPFPVFLGRLVGGSTAVNGGTIFRAPPWVLDRFSEETASDEFEPARMEAHYAQVERTLGVAPADVRFAGPIRDVVRRGCEALGWSHFTVQRNAPGCEGQGFCDFGCRTDARRSTNVSYVPAALEKGAVLYTRLRAERVILEGARAAGIEGRAPNGRRVHVRARATIVAGGALPTPLFLRAQGLCATSGQLGRNLTLHPSGGVSAVMDDEIRGWERIPQSCGSDQHLRDGILLVGALPDVNYAAITFPVTGAPLMERIAALPWTATFGILIADAGKGRLAGTAAGMPVVRYELQPADVERMRRGMIAQAEIALAAGARTVLPVLYGEGGAPLRSRADLDRLRRAAIKPGHLPLTSYHPLGTARMGRDPRTSVVDLDHQTHDVPRLYIVDGSTVSGPLGVNPQHTIMAMATRAAGRIAEHLA